VRHTCTFVSLTFVVVLWRHGFIRHQLNFFVIQVYAYYDIVIWSQTNWHWLDLKLHELGLLVNPDFKICFALDKLSMFAVKQISVKPLQVIWNFCPERWSPSNTVHVDDLARNFELNPQCGLMVKAFYIDSNAPGAGSLSDGSRRPFTCNGQHNDADVVTKTIGHISSISSDVSIVSESSENDTEVHVTVSSPIVAKKAEVDEDDELLVLSKYLVKIARSKLDFKHLSHNTWREQVASWSATSPPPTGFGSHSSDSPQ
jgi:hypothetical protein